MGNFLFCRRAFKATFILVPLFGLQLFGIIYRPSPQARFYIIYDLFSGIMVNLQVCIHNFLTYFAASMNSVTNNKTNSYIYDISELYIFVYFSILLLHLSSEKSDRVVSLFGLGTAPNSPSRPEFFA